MKHFSFTRLTIVLVTLLAIALAGCGKKTPAPEVVENTYADENARQIEELNNQLFAGANLSPSRSDYLLGPGDLLEVKIFEAEKLNATVRLSSRGAASLPLLGEVNLQGKTAAEAETWIENKYRETYIKNPHVSIFVKEHYSQRVTVVGEVKNPGTYDYPSKQRLLDAIALAGGLTEKAGHTIQVRRLDSMSHGSQQTFLVNLKELINEGKTELNISINGGDVIFVPEAGSFFVDGAVRRPGKYAITDVLSVNEAILAAGGLAPYANDEQLVLLRKTDTGEREKLQVQLDENGRAPEKINVRDGDMILVDSSFWGRLLHGGGVNIGVPGMGVTYRDPAR
ncbi:MAG: SLBB domain-containing protein [Desulfobacterales bacterium]|nr:SLBB domain-containing protein [Desulfobacterales bacterium]